ncbi:hypothetical protein AVEN_201659-1 [Araneus ventricosus]|uniref:Mos1 transposase HTH domain-containing protein n=1 Tax=Araneus ventricosus TaxID=182803 RepID=A0A4Y2U376_ARAVE|nr:hypothetical protein AVEN_238035-1 [Araneus ventricosus]GBO06122.1 hypothetical protein AVEN_201659-1 [Araneus ventricosus]
MRSTRRKWCALCKLTPTLKYAEQYVFVGKRFMRTEIHSEISAVYRPGKHAMSRTAIVKWCQQFEDGRTDLSDAERQGRPTTVSKHIRHGAAGGRHYSQQWQNERRMHCTGFGNICCQSVLRLSRVLQVQRTFEWKTIFQR